jgi:hypothetical protein
MRVIVTHLSDINGNSNIILSFVGFGYILKVLASLMADAALALIEAVSFLAFT